MVYQFMGNDQKIIGYLKRKTKPKRGRRLSSRDIKELNLENFNLVDKIKWAYIYIIIFSKSKEIKYIGSTINLRTRLKDTWPECFRFPKKYEIFLMKVPVKERYKFERHCIEALGPAENKTLPSDKRSWKNK